LRRLTIPLQDDNVTLTREFMPAYIISMISSYPALILIIFFLGFSIGIKIGTIWGKITQNVKNTIEIIKIKQGFKKELKNKDLNLDSIKKRNLKFKLETETNLRRLMKVFIKIEEKSRKNAEMIEYINKIEERKHYSSEKPFMKFIQKIRVPILSVEKGILENDIKRRENKINNGIENMKVEINELLVSLKKLND